MLWIIIFILIALCYKDVLGVIIFVSIIWGITALVVHLGGYDNSDGHIFFNVLYVVVGVLGFIWFIGFCIKHKDD